MSLRKRLVGLGVGTAASLAIAHATDLVPDKVKQHPSTIEELLETSELLGNSPPILTTSVSVPANEVSIPTAETERSHCLRRSK